MTIRSELAWLDFTDDDRRQMIEVVQLFRVRETRDELGIGSVRDAFADLFFPGTSTIQTRARYFLFVPWLYRNYEKKQVPSSKIPSRLRRHELKLIDSLRSAGQTEGLIGRISGESLQRFPSSIYWNGLHSWGIRRFEGSQSQYHRWLDHYYQSRGSGTRTDDGDPIGESAEANWDPHLPDPPADFPQAASFDLRLEEAEYLRERLLASVTETLLSYLVDQTQPVEQVSFVWLHPEVSDFPERYQEQLGHARNFSELMHGAAFLYNLMLAELAEMHERVEEYSNALVNWSERLGQRWRKLESWDRAAFWSLVAETGNVPWTTQRFVDRWWDLVLNLGPESEISSNETARALIQNREIGLKRSRSRFRSQRHLELWGGEAGTGQLDYRWSNARIVVNDIVAGLGRS